jgi:ribosomal protein L37AE/L43A
MNWFKKISSTPKCPYCDNQITEELELLENNSIRCNKCGKTFTMSQWTGFTPANLPTGELVNMASGLILLTKLN